MQKYSMSVSTDKMSKYDVEVCTYEEEILNQMISRTRLKEFKR